MIGSVRISLSLASKGPYRYFLASMKPAARRNIWWRRMRKSLSFSGSLYSGGMLCTRCTWVVVERLPRRVILLGH
jgi:hypothetical protein